MPKIRLSFWYFFFGEQQRKSTSGWIEIEYRFPTRLSRNLRRLLTSYLVLKPDGHLMDIEDLLTDMQNLFELLDTASDELSVGV